MKIIKELSTNTSYDEIKNIYTAKGHKVAIAFNEEVTIAYLDVAIDETTGAELGDSVKAEEMRCIPGITVRGNSIRFIGGNELVLMDSIGDGSFLLYPFRDEYSSVFVTFEMHDPDGKIADRVVEVV